MSLYDDPQVYDVLYTPGTAGECDVLERIAHRWSPIPGKPWLEPACGTGRLLRVLDRRGRRVLGFDREPAMIAYARRRVPAARLFVADLVRFAHRVRARSVGFAFNPFNTLRLLDSDAAMLAHFGEMAQVLDPRGVYAVGVSFTRFGSEPLDEDLWQGRRGGLQVRQLLQYLPPGTWEHHGRAGRAGRTSRSHRFERVVSHVVVTRGSRAESQDSTYDLRCYEAGQWRRLIARSALRPVATLDALGMPVTTRPPYAIEILGVRQVSAARSRGRSSSRR